ncbi:MAG: anti-sigma B factor RsbW [candidate division WS1 bacterium]|nr:anti-sigma B factor RsbW [candidate division WS1 bacterium]
MTRTSLEVVQLTIPPHPRYLSLARLLVGGLGAQSKLTVEDLDDMKVAVSEAITNAIDHAYEPDAPGEIIIRYRPSEGQLVVEVEDSGSGFDPDKLDTSPPVPDLEGGLGLYLVRELADQVKVESAPGSGTKVIITKRAHG